MAKAIVIGAGFGGIAAALRLRKKGYDVTIIDKQDKLGGRAYQYVRETPHGRFVHDAGPTVITAKFLFDELFELFGKRREDYVEFRDIYPWYRIVFAGEVTRDRLAAALVPRSADDRGTSAAAKREDLPFFDYGGTLEQFEAQIAKFEPRDVEGFRKFLAHSKKIFDVGFTQLGDQPFDQFTTMLKCAPQLLRLQNYKTVYGMASKYISNESLRRVFSFQPLLVGGNPFNTTSIYSLIFYLERQWGVQFAMGGTGAIVRGLERLMREEGIEILLGHEAKIHLQGSIRIVHQLGFTADGSKAAEDQSGDDDDDTPMTPERRAAMHEEVRRNLKQLERTLKRNQNAKFVPRVVRISTDAGFDVEVGAPEMTGDLVVANGDAPDIYDRFIKPEYRKGLAARRLHSALGTRHSALPALKFSMGLFVLYFGTTKPYPDVAHHTIVLGHEYKNLITKLFDTLELETEDLSVYLHRPTATDASMAPAGCESFYCLVPVPNLQPPKRGTGFQPVSLTQGLETHATAIPTTADGVIDWATYGDTYKKHVIDYLERTVLPGLSDCIVDDFYVTPKHFEQNLNTLHGSGFSIQPIFSQSAWFRFHNKAPGIEGLYFVGAGTHPGAGMPGVLCSAKVVDRLVPAVTPNAQATDGAG